MRKNTMRQPESSVMPPQASGPMASPRYTADTTNAYHLTADMRRSERHAEREHAKMVAAATP